MEADVEAITESEVEGLAAGVGAEGIKSSTTPHCSSSSNKSSTIAFGIFFLKAMGVL
jgi:hypothetical protein